MKVIIDRPDDYSPRIFFKSWFGLYKKRVLLKEVHEFGIGKKFHRENRFNRHIGYLRAYRYKQRLVNRVSAARRSGAGKSFFNFWVVRQPVS